MRDTELPKSDRNAAVRVIKPDEGMRGELLYPAAGVVVVVVLWLMWIFIGADWVRGRVEANVSAPASASPAQIEAVRATLVPHEKPSSAPVESAAKPPEIDGKSTAVGERFTQLGQTGDLFGGVNALFAAIALIGVFWAATMQWRSLSEGRRASAEQRFETMFFELLRLTREVLERIDVSAKPQTTVEATRTGTFAIAPPPKNGASALNALASRYFANFNFSRQSDLRAFELQRLVREYKLRVYDSKPSALGPYFRLLFQTFDLVANAPVTEKEKVRYSNIARGQISEGAVLLLALNGLTWRGWKFVPLIERFGLLEHMHQRYLRDFGSLLRVAYRECAFQGSEMRAKSLADPAPEPGPYRFDKDPAAPDFVVSSPMTVPPDDV